MTDRLDFKITWESWIYSKVVERSKIARQLILTLLSIQKTGRKIEGG
ncbi:hypothetical protein QIQ_2950 [Clostridioides difficile DA00130]|nr:hypothetical protein [Clostridioides difficile]EQE15339.1 hypothetical protein QAW_3159 [Clostridioides difficile CD17]EQG39378.1 hypothetical protein QIS_2943 [Clostridioides difficile DA00131]ERM27177.1 hypothetical protein QIQ_2950 [Clostridioides difficile DA00130]